MNQFLIDSWRNEDDFLATMLVFGAIVAFFALLVSVIIILVLIVAVAVLVGAGIVSTSVLYGIKNKSAGKGMKFFFVLCCTLLCTCVTLILSEFINAIWKYYDGYTVAFFGIIAGILSGYAVGLLLYTTARKLFDIVLNKFHK